MPSRTKEEILSDLTAKMRNRTPAGSSRTGKDVPGTNTNTNTNTKTSKPKTKKSIPRTTNKKVPSTKPTKSTTSTTKKKSTAPLPESLNCAYCGKEFKPKTRAQLYCSAYCRNEYHKAKHRIKDIPEKRNCLICGKEFEPKSRANIYCSVDCNTVAQNKKKQENPYKYYGMRPKDRIVRVKCGNPNCPNGGVFETTEELYRKRKKYCDEKCSEEAQRLKYRLPKPKREKPVSLADEIVKKQAIQEAAIIDAIHSPTVNVNIAQLENSGNVEDVKASSIVSKPKKAYKVVKKKPTRGADTTRAQKETAPKKGDEIKTETKTKTENGKSKSEEKAIIDYEPHSGGQREIHDDYNVRFRVINAGTRWGKDRCSINEFIRLFAHMLSEERDSSLVPRVHGWIVAPTFPLARQSWRELKYFFPASWIVGKNEAEHQLTTVRDGIIEVKSADNPDSLVSVGLDLVLMTEAARVKDLETTWGYLRGRLSSPGRGLDGQGGSALINSTPKGRGFYYTMYCWGSDPNMPEWKSYHHPTSDNPYIHPKEVEEARRTLPDKVFRQEFLAEFLSDSGDVFANIDDVSIGTIQEPIPGKIYKAAWDPAQKHDWSSFGIRDENGQQVVLERWTGLPWTDQLDRVEIYCKRYNNASMEVDCTGIGETLVEAAQQRGINVNGNFFNNASKEQWVSHLAILFENRIPVLLDPGINVNTKAQMEELKSYTYTYTKTGKISYHHLPGQHDDCVDMLLLLYKDFHSSIMVLPYMGLLLGGNRWKLT